MAITNDPEQQFAIISENDESKWHDRTGVLYHFPNKYQKLLLPGTRVIYYKSKLKNAKFSKERLSDEPHYFGTATIGKVFADANSPTQNKFAEIIKFQICSSPILAKMGTQFLEKIPQNRKTNYWRDGVRNISAETYHDIISKMEGRLSEPSFADDDVNDLDNALESGTEGSKSKRYVTVYERDPELRKMAIAIHGLNCTVCNFNFEETYGEYAKGYIHIHHLVPVSSSNGVVATDPQSDLRPVCANCHSIIHRRRNNTLTIEEMRTLWGRQKTS